MPRTVLGGTALAALLAVTAPASAQAPELTPVFSTRSLLGGQSFSVGGTLPGGAADAGRTVRLHERRAPFPGRYAIVQSATAGPGGEFAFTVTPVRKAYWAVVAPATATAARAASRGHLVALRRKVSIRSSTRRPRKGSAVRFSGFVSPAFPIGPSSVATLQRRDRAGGFGSVGVVLLRSAGAYSSYRLRTRIRRSGVYRVVVPSSSFFSRGASVGITLRVRRRR
jgi:hypothetical protein